jgi:hypothetical protein
MKKTYFVLFSVFALLFFDINAQCGFTLSLPSDTIVCSQSNIDFTIDASVSPQSAYTYEWVAISSPNGVASLSGISVLTPSFDQQYFYEDTFMFVLTVEDTAACSVSDTFTVITEGGYGMNLPRDTSICDSAFSDFIYMIDSNLDVQFWGGWAAENGVSGYTMPVFYDVAYLDSMNINYLKSSVLLNDPITGCSYDANISVFVDSCFFVWPGDANNDNVVNVFDVLPLGVAYGALGPRRDSISFDWSAKYGLNWGGGINGLNLAHADCDGDGQIDDHDLNVVDLNYSLIHNKIGDIQSSVFIKSAPTLKATFNMDTAADESSIIVFIQLGDANQPTDSVCGMAFSMNYDPSYIKAGTPAVDVYNGGPFGYMQTLSLDNNSVPGQMDFAITRIDRADSASFDPICGIKMDLENIIAFGSLQVDTFFVWFSKVEVVNKDYVPVPVNIVTDSVLIAEGLITYLDERQKGLLLYPNPIRDHFFVKTDASAEKILKVYNAFGSIVYTSAGDFSEGQRLDISHWPAGVYVIELQGQKSYEQRKILVY